MPKLATRIYKQLNALLQSCKDHPFVALLVFLIATLEASGVPLLTSFQKWLPEILPKEILLGEYSLQVWHLLLCLTCTILGSVITTAWYRYKNTKDNTKFIESSDLLWKTSKHYTYIKPDPYCPKHKIKLLIDPEGLYCSECNELIFTFDDIEKDELLPLMRELAENKAEQVIENTKLKVIK